jgi:hypothetical protein
MTVLFLTATAALAETSPLALPQFADGGGWRSSLVIVNTFGVDSAHIVINFRGQDGRRVVVPLEGYGAISSLDVHVPIQSSLYLETTGTSPVAQSGWVEIQQKEGSNPVRAYAVFRQSVPGRPDYEAVSVGMRAAAGMTFPFDNTAGFVTSYSLVNFGLSDCTVGVSPIYDEGGTALASRPRVAANVAANGHIAFVSTDRMPELAGKRGYLKFFPMFGCSGGIGALGLRFNPNGPFTNLLPLVVDPQ